MPHYADGTEAKVGDHVIAPVFNSGHVVAGTIVSITPGAESCNAMIAFAEVRTSPDDRPRMAILGREPRPIKTYAHGSGGPEALVFECADYCDTNKLTKIS